ncbi:UDP-glucuronate--glycolipid 2-beta-glucuronosyltransferase [Nostoc sp. 3335mG]|nr:UDP-glucuronate--glycolipid 2-beta-glucuronosyltransferase [Nostoc sp. 3335mG]
MTGGGRNVVFLSAYHDYRTAKRASIQQVADGLVGLGYDVSFVSTRFSRLSKITGDSRLFLWDKANRVETVNGVHCYLWRTVVHPFQSGNRLLNAAMARLYPLYAELPDRQFDAIFRAADYVVLEASVAAILMRRIKRINPDVRIIYYATDRLDTVGAHPFIRQRLEDDAGLIDHVCLRSPRMAPDFQWAKGKLYRAEFGIEPKDFAGIGPSPYPPGRQTAVSVGSMLFDPSFFQLAAARFPDVDFHVIGCGTTFDAPANVHIHAEMKFVDTLPYVKHATVGIAPYLPAPGVEYLAESSLKMAQYEYFALPAVCPAFAVGDTPSRFGYTPGDAASIATAMTAALDAAGTVTPRMFLTWREVAERVIDPQAFPGTKIG